MASGEARQLVICHSQEQLSLMARIFPALEARLANGEWEDLEGRKVFALDGEIAAYAVGYAGKLRYLPEPWPDGATDTEIKAWVKAHAVDYAAGAETPSGRQEKPQGSNIPSYPESTPLPAAPLSPPPVAATATPPVADQPVPPPPPEGGEPDKDARIAQDALGTTQPPDDQIPLSAYENEPEAAKSRPAGISEGWISPNADWPAPANLWIEEAYALPSVTRAMLSPAIADYVEDQAQLRGVDPSVVALNCIGALSGALHNSLGVRPKPGESGYIERPVLWVCTAGNSGTKKNSAQDIAIAPLLPIDREMRLAVMARMQDRADADAQYQDDLTAWRKGKQVGPRPVPPEPVAMDRLLVDQFTMEGLRGVLQHNSRKKCLLVATELAAVFGGLDAYSNKQGKDAPLLLRLYDSSPAIIDRAPPAPSVYIESWSSSILGAVTPSSLERITVKGGYDSDGMMQRFMVILAKQGKLEQQRPANAQAASAYARILKNAVSLHAGEHPCNFSPEAQEVRDRFIAWAHSLSVSGALPDNAVSSINKYPGLFARLCLVYHAATCADAGLLTIAPEISEDTALQVKELISGLIFPHGLRFYQSLEVTGATHAPVLRVAGFVLATDTQELRTTQLHNNLSMWRKLDSKQKRECLAVLIEAGWLRKKSETQFLVNPLAHQLYAEQARKEIARRDQYAQALAQKLGREAGED